MKVEKSMHNLITRHLKEEANDSTSYSGNEKNIFMLITWANNN